MLGASVPSDGATVTARRAAPLDTLPGRLIHRDRPPALPTSTLGDAAHGRGPALAARPRRCCLHHLPEKLSPPLLDGLGARCVGPWERSEIGRACRHDRASHHGARAASRGRDAGRGARRRHRVNPCGYAVCGGVTEHVEPQLSSE